MTLQTRMVKDPDHPLNAHPFETRYPEPLCDLRPFQEALTRLFGTEGTTGRPWVRVIWAQDERSDEYGPIAKNWSHYGNGGRGEWRARYLYSADRYFEPEMNYETGVLSHYERWHDLAPPRFVIETFVPPDMACMGWNELTEGASKSFFGTYYDAQGDVYTPYKAIYGMYQPLPVMAYPHMLGGVLAYHDRDCCRAAEVSDRTCYGYYVEPGGIHLGIMEEMANQVLNEARERRPGVMTGDEHEATRKRTREHNAKYWGEYEQRIRQIALEACYTHEAAFSESDKKRRWGKFNFGASKSGATAQQIESWRKEKASIWKP